MADVKMPKLGESVTEGTLGTWLKKVGDTVSKYEPLVEVVTDKVNAEIPSDFEGVLTEIVVPEGQTVGVGTIICRIQETGEASVSLAQVETPTAPQTTASASASVEISQAVVREPGQQRYSPAVLKLAGEHGIDLNQVQGTGDGGRITRKDVLAFAETRRQSVDAKQTSVVASAAPVTQQTAVASSQPTGVAPSGTQVSAGGAATSDSEEIIIPSAIRKTIAKRMVESKHTAPHAWTTVEVDVSSLVAYRERVKKDFSRKEGVSLTYLPFFVKAVAEALKQYPMLNAAWINDEIHVKKHVNVSIAVATDDSLVVPVIKDADRLSIAGLAHAIHDLATRARAGRLTLDDVQDGTFTLNNTGAFGSILSQPIINAPQAAILSVESIVKRPVVIHDAIAIRSMVNLCLSLDHRLLDGWVSGQFLQAVKERVERYDAGTVIY